MREGLRLVEQQEAAEKAKLKALRAAAQLGIDDMEAGRFRRFNSSEELQRYLRGLADEVLGRKRRSRPKR